ncbi:DUF4250 domain-containing protein [Clostridium fallax]|uniref:DUF4250 domain-containing protein n=1 Tax=Clostridium fallax TaxID=1533 RepID=A0A1M4VWE7_9CLOT|nr:DUF4250 domain-containing protein [Clostridium fallax]SHE73193.1 protein of unknown function [Clostridium fallax]SQB07724.1 Uncharacterised protein [Clostridium fallax]
MELGNLRQRDPFMLLSIINLKLRDYYNSLFNLCDDLNVDEKELKDVLLSVGYVYNEENNQFVLK